MANFNAGVYREHFGYKSFLPALINKPFTISDKEIYVLLEQAGLHLGQLEAFSQLVPDIDLFIKMHIYKEATLSSRIEGTQTTMDEAVSPEPLILPEHRDDWAEIQNYTKAIHFAQEELKNIPISLRLIKDIHAVLLQGVRGEHKLPGQIRTSQNWIGGSNLKDAFFIPPHFEDLPELLSDLEKFWHNPNLDIPILVKVAMFHYQFETIHPFCDGNGRIGRLLIPLMLISQGILSKPALYISDFFEKHRGNYYDSLTMVRSSNNMEQWIKFFLSGIIDTAKNGTQTLSNVVAYKKQLDEKILALGSRAELGEKLFKEMLVNPVVNKNFIAKTLGVSYSTTNRLVKDLIALGVLKNRDQKLRNQYFKLNGYLELFK